MRFGLSASFLFLLAGCASLDSTMQQSLGKPVSEVFREHGGPPNAGKTKINDNRYMYPYKYYRTRYAGRQYLGTTGQTSYYTDVCYARYLYQTYYTDANDIVIDYQWEYTEEWQISCN